MRFDLDTYKEILDTITRNKSNLKDRKSVV